MPKSWGSVEMARTLDGLIQSGSLVGLSDEDLLAQFVESRDPRAFEAILERHGPLVLTVCRHVLNDPNDVEDAFQASFLVLIRKAASVRRPGSLASWLYGVAYRTASRLKRTATSIRLVTDHSEASGPCPLVEVEQMNLLHEEIDDLPEKYRQPIVLCYFEGLTHDDAAAQLRWPVGTVRGRLARARDRLRDRLDRRGVSLSAGLPAALDRLRSSSSILPQGLLHTTKQLLEHSVSLRISSLVHGVIFTMLINKLKWTVLALAASSLMVVAVGTGLRAVASQAEKKGGGDSVRQAGSEALKRQDHVRTKAIPITPGKTESEANEELADRLEKHRVDAELLEIKTQSLKSALQRNMQMIRQFEGQSGTQRMSGGGTPADRIKNEENYHRTYEDLIDRTESMTHKYKEARLELARLKRQIARESKALEQPPTETDPAGLNRRLQTLESKVDEILQKLSKDPN